MATPHFSPSSSYIVALLLMTSMQLLQHVQSKTYWRDVEVLKQIKNRVDRNSVSQGSCLSSWDFSVDPCNNLFSDKFVCGFRCDATISDSLRVTELTLDQAGYSGSFDSISWDLPYLQIIDLSSNNFYGQIPQSFSNLTRLTRLSLSRNWFSGQIPNSIGSLRNLEEMYLDNNNLEGPIPESFASLSSLKRLEMQSNKLSGEFPNLGSLKSLDFIDASDNGMSGELPETLPASAIQVSMRNNSLEGGIPQSYKLLSSLQVLDLSHNRLSGSVPSFLFTQLPPLQQLTLSHNSFTSVQSPFVYYMPTTFVQSELIAIDLSNNVLQGFLPYFMSLIPKLSALSLENNRFGGMIPTQYAIKAVVPGPGFSPFERLLLGGNYLVGPIPGPLMQLKPGSLDVSLTGNCLYRCPTIFFFCQGGQQRSLVECKRFSPVIPFQ